MNEINGFVEKIRQNLWFQQDLAYRDFCRSLIPNIDPERIIGVRAPIIKKIAKGLDRGQEKEKIFHSPLYYQEEKQVLIQLLNQERDFDLALARVQAFFPLMDNWALTDSLLPKAFKKEGEKILSLCKKWAKSDQEFVARFAIVLMMKIYLKEGQGKDLICFVGEIPHGGYYLNMMIAWFLAEALIYEEEEVLDLLKGKTLFPWIQNKAIQKARESKRIGKDLKIKLVDLKRKNPF